jgi:DNA polymerase I
MLINVDASSLEVNCAAFLSQDQVLMNEILNGLDIHSRNQEAFGLPTRLIAKVLVFRLIYGGTEHSFARDPDFTPVSRSKEYWAKVIDKFYSKYKGLAAWHTRILQEVTVSSELIMPTGRRFTFVRNERGEWPVTTIKNYPVQSLGADIMTIARVDFARRFWNNCPSGKLISTVHDSIVADVEKKDVDKTIQLMYDVFKDIPRNFKNIFGYEYSLPLGCEVKIGNNLRDLEKVNQWN